MGFAGQLGAQVRLARVPHALPDAMPPSGVLLFSESNSRFLCEVKPEHETAFRELLQEVPHAKHQWTSLRLQRHNADQTVAFVPVDHRFLSGVDLSRDRSRAQTVLVHLLRSLGDHLQTATPGAAPAQGAAAISVFDVLSHPANPPLKAFPKPSLPMALL